MRRSAVTWCGLLSHGGEGGAGAADGPFVLRIDDDPTGLLQFRTRAVSVMATALSISTLLFLGIAPVTLADFRTSEVVLCIAAACLHGVAGWTVGRSWEPGGRVSVVYLAGLTAVVLLAVAQGTDPATDAFWFLLVPVGLSGVALGGRRHAALTAAVIAGYHVALVVGPGYEAATAIPRSGALTLVAWALWALTAKLGAALAEAADARTALEHHLGEVTRLNDRLTELDALKDDFVSTASHELRTPLTVILGFAATMNSRWDQLTMVQRRELSTRIEAQARSVEGIVGTLLDTARIERGTLEARDTRVVFADAASSTVERFASLLRHHDVRVDITGEPVVRTDARLLERVLDNLLSNAARHTPEGSTVTVAAAPRQDGTLLVEVRDDGPGIEADEVARLGERFFRAGDVETRSREGVGLGLALVGDVLAAMGTALEVTSEVGVGTTFGFALPLWADEPPAEVRPITAAVGAAPR